MDEVLNWLVGGLCVALAARVALRVLTRVPASHRYAIGWAALLIVLVLPFMPALRELGGSADIAQAADRDAILRLPESWWASGRFVIVLAGMWCLANIIRAAASLAAVSHAKRSAAPFPKAVTARLAHWNAVRGRGRPARLVISDAVRAAAVLGGRAPVIAVSPAIVRHLEPCELDLIVVHEWAHVQRRDDLVDVAHFAVRAIAGWHPAVWWLDRRLRSEREAACDEIAVAVTGSARKYAAALAETAAIAAARRGVLAPAHIGALSSSGFARRLTHILARGQFTPVRWSTAAALAAVASLGAIALTVDQVQIAATGSLASPAEMIGAVAFRPDMGVDAAAASHHSIGEGSIAARRAERRTRLRAAVTPNRGRSPIHATAAARTKAETSSVVLTRAAEALPLGTSAALPGNIDIDIAAPPTAAALVDARLPVATADATRKDAPWTVAAAMGTTIGRGSQAATISTAGFFRRFGKRVAASF